MNVLVIAPHPDDESIGPGGMVCLHVERGDRVAAVFLTSGEFAMQHLPREDVWRIREAEAREATGILGVGQLTFLRCPDWFVGDHVAEAAALLRPVLEWERPELVYLPHPREWHPDHQASLPVFQSALSGLALAEPLVRTYEVWTPLTEYDEVEDITSVMERKLAAIRCYRSQLDLFKYDRAVEGLNAYRGELAAHCRYAEAFAYVDILTVQRGFTPSPLARP